MQLVVWRPIIVTWPELCPRGSRYLALLQFVLVQGKAKQLGFEGSVNISNDHVVILWFGSDFCLASGHSPFRSDVRVVTHAFDAFIAGLFGTCALLAFGADIF